MKYFCKYKKAVVLMMGNLLLVVDHLNLEKTLTMLPSASIVCINPGICTECCILDCCVSEGTFAYS